MMSQFFRQSLLRISFSAMIALSAGMLCAQVPTITSFSPTSGPVGTTVTITGTNFDPVAENNIVWFGAVKAAVITGTPTELIVTVPAGTTYEPVTVTANGLTAYSARPFNVTFQSSRVIDEKSFAPRVDFNTGTTPYDSEIGDIDGDGKPDLVIVNFESNTLSVFRNSGSLGIIGSGSFSSKVDFITGSSPSGVAIGDIDGDGKNDIVVANYGSGSISIFRNVSTTGFITTGSLSAKVDLDAKNRPWDLAIGDLDGDGKSDLCVTDLVDDVISVFRNNSIPGSINAGSFEARVDFSTGGAPYEVVIRDIDGDSKPDLIVNSYNEPGLISVYRNIGAPGSVTSGSFEPRVDLVTEVGPWGVAVADIDGDDKPDLITNNVYHNRISIFRNISTTGFISAGSFASRVDFSTGDSSYDLAVGDIDGDGKADLAVSNNGNSSVSVFKNKSSEGIIDISSFSLQTALPVGTEPWSLSLGDFDGDGKPEIAVGNRENNNVSILHNIIPESSPPSITSFIPLSGPVGTEVIITGSGFSEQAVDNTVTFGAVEAIVTAATANQLTVTVPAGAISDFISVTVNGLTAASGTSFIVTLPPPVILSFTPAYGSPGTTVTITGSNFSSDTPGNIVRFGTVQAAVISATVTQLIVTVPAGATTQPIYVEVNGMTAFTTTSFVVVQPPLIYSFSPESGPVGTTVTINGSNFSLTPADNIVWFGATRATVTAATVTQLTATVPSGASYNPITVTVSGLTAYSGKPFNVTFPSSNVIDAYSFGAKVDFPTGTNPFSIDIGDMDGDGKPDLIVTNQSSNSISVFRNTSTSGSISTESFAAKIDFTSETNPYNVAIGDIDGDGKQDLVAVNRSNNTVSVFRNTSIYGSITAGSFAAKVDFITGPGPNDVVIGDIDGDGRPDLAVTNGNNNTISVFRNTGSYGSITTGSFAPKVDFPAGKNPYFAAIGDIDGDGKPDLAIVNYDNDGTISVFRNTSTAGSLTTGSFAAKVDFTVGIGPQSIVMGDIDGNGTPDLAVTNLNSSSVSVFSNTSTPGIINTSSFATKVDFTTGAGPIGLAFSDINGDGKPDLAIVSTQSTNTVSILRNTCDPGSITTGSFSTKIDYVTGLNPNIVAIGDIDGDGKPDLIVTNSGSNSVSVLRNTLTEPVPPVINSFTPSSGPVGATVTITGSNFSANGSSNIVRFGGQGFQADIISASETQLVVTVPNEASSGPITVTVNGQTGSTNMPFMVTPSPLVEQVNPNSGPVGSTVTINGSNFSSDQSQNVVMFGNVRANIISSTQNQLIVTVPDGAGGQEIIVSISGYIINTGVFFSVTEPQGLELESAILTLNGDGINEVFRVKNFQQYGASKFRVYNSRAALVYWNDDFQGEWDVTLHNMRFETGGYFYVIETSIGTFRGSFSILK